LHGRDTKLFAGGGVAASTGHQRDFPLDVPLKSKVATDFDLPARNLPAHFFFPDHRKTSMK
jgi:hypothetical protein